MRHVLPLCSILIVLAVVVAVANPIVWPPRGEISPTADPEGIYGLFVEGPPGLVPIYIVMWPGYSAAACQFSAVVPTCSGAQYLSDTAVFPVTIGNSQEGVAIGFGTCQQPPVHVMTINVFYQGGGGECCFMWVRPAPNVVSGEIEIVDCQNNMHFGTGGAAIFNPDENDCMQYVPTQPSTWGKVKALYAD